HCRESSHRSPRILVTMLSFWITTLHGSDRARAMLVGPSRGGAVIETTDTRDVGATIALAEAQELMSRWWHLYDAGRMDELAELFTEDAVFHCRSDSGATPYEEFVTAHLSGRDEIMAWQRQHRDDSPHPLRHH